MYVFEFEFILQNLVFLKQYGIKITNPQDKKITNPDINQVKCNCNILKNYKFFETLNIPKIETYQAIKT